MKIDISLSIGGYGVGVGVGRYVGVGECGGSVGGVGSVPVLTWWSHCPLLVCCVAGRREEGGPVSDIDFYTLSHISGLGPGLWSQATQR